ncbi:MAG: phenylacetate--CoA ligase family protein [Proteobacteria bacterium]|nr:phenylacetate--CoA ligase family protein [Pseudomonadota bacterium]
MMDSFFTIFPKQVRTALYRAMQSTKGETGRYRFADATEQIAHLPIEELHALQVKRLKQTLTYAGEKVPYWRDLFRRQRFDPAGVTKPSDIEVLPILTKDIIRAEGDRMISSDYDKSRLVIRKTGGSTGEPLIFWIDRVSLERQMAVNLRSFRMLGLREDDHVAKIWGYGKSQRLENTFAPISSRLFLDAFKTSESDMENWYRQLIRFRPAAIYGYAVAISHFARFLKQTGRRIDSLKVVCTTSERLFPEMRRDIAAALGVPVADMYGCHESVRLASECLHGNMHIHMDSAVVEFVREGDRLSGPGNIVITSLLSQAQPFIRFNVGDMGTPRSDRCSCGLPFPLMSLDVGKVHHIFHLPGGRTVHSAILFKRVYRLKGISAFQIRHTALDRIEIATVPIPGKEDILKREIASAIANFQKELGPEVVIESRLVDEVPRTPSGKQPPVVSEVAEDKTDC